MERAGGDSQQAERAPGMTKDYLWTLMELRAERLRVSQSKLKELIRTGLPVIRLGHRTVRISEAALREYLAARTDRRPEP